MKKLTKAQEKLLEEVKEFLSTLDDVDKDEWYDTERGFHKDCLENFLWYLGIQVSIDED